MPSFAFILAGGPLVEATHGKLGFTAPPSAIIAAVVGVILNLAMFFAYQVLRPQGLGARFDGLSAAIIVLATVALFRFRLDVMPLLGICAAAGMLTTLLPLATTVASPQSAPLQFYLASASVVPARIADTLQS